MHINLSEIMSNKGSSRQMEVPLEMESFLLNGSGYHFASKEPVRLTLTCTGDRLVKLEGGTNVSLNIPCARCLEDVETSFGVSFSKELVFNETGEVRDRDLNEANYVDGYNLNVDQLIYNEILVLFPIRVLCSEDCRGICSLCGKNLNQGACDCDRAVVDPRMSVIQDIFNNFKEV